MASPLTWALELARAQTLSLVADVPAVDGCLQTSPGEHHPVWTVGHLLLGDSFLLTLLGAGPLPADFETLLRRYGPGAKPEPAADRYDALDDLVGRLREIGAHRVETIGRLSDADLARTTPDPLLATSQPTIAHHLQALLCHEGYHSGELAAWRRRRGMGSVRWAFAPRSR